MTQTSVEMNTTSDVSDTASKKLSDKNHTGRWIAIGLVMGVVCGLLFGEYCAVLQDVGRAYVGLLQMTVLPYLVVSIVSKMGRLNLAQARRLGFTALSMLLVFWAIGIALVVLVSTMLPPIEGASFFNPGSVINAQVDHDYLSRFIPTNVFMALSKEYVPAVVVFCLFLGCALMLVPGKEPLLDLLDLFSEGLGRINMFLVRLAPIGLFTLTAAAAGTLHLDELSRLQAYLIMLTLACVAAVFGVLPLLLSSVTDIRSRDLFRVAQEPLLTAIATGKLFVVLPQIIDKCDLLLQQEEVAEQSSDDTTQDADADDDIRESTASVVVPLAYPFPHIGKVLAFVFISFAAWYSGNKLTSVETTVMAATGTLSSFASPLLTMPYLLDQNHLPQDLMALFIVPGFITMRLGDLVGVMHLMVLTLIVSRAIQGRLRIHWKRLALASTGVLACLFVAGAASRQYLASTTLAYDLDEKLLALEIPQPHDNVIVYRSRQDAPSRNLPAGSTLQHVRNENVLRVGYHPDQLPYSFFNSSDHLVGLDIELMHRLASRLEVRLEFVPYDFGTVIEELEAGEIDVALGGLIMNPERLVRVGFTRPYQTATIAVVLPDYRRDELNTWDDPQMAPDLKLGTIHGDVASAARRELPNVEIIVIDSIRDFFTENRDNLDGLIMPAEEGAAWNVLYPEHAIVVPRPTIQRPVGMAVRSLDAEWLRALDRWLEFERLDGSLDRLRAYWIEGGGTQQKEPRWCVMRDELGWLP